MDEDILPDEPEEESETPEAERWLKWERDIAKSLGHDERDIPPEKK